MQKENKEKVGKIHKNAKQIRSFEQKFTGIFGLIFDLPYNLGACALTLVMWLGCFFFAYSSTGNFNLFPTIVGYMILGSLAGIIYGRLFVGNSESIKTDAATITKLGIVSLILSVFMLMGVKIFTFQWLGLYVLSPLAIFSFFVLLKSIWISLE